MYVTITISVLFLIFVFFVVGQDYSNVSIVVNFSSGQTLASVSIPIMDDSLFENLERFTVSITAITGATVFPLSSAVISIVDNDGTFVSILV